MPSPPPGIGDEELVIDGFHDIIRKDRTRHWGGVAIYVKTDLNFKKRLDLDLDIESISIEHGIKYVKPIIISTLYRPPDSLVELFDPIENWLVTLIRKTRNVLSQVIFNCTLLIIMQVSISSITIPPRTPGICTKNLSPPWGFCILAFARGWGFVGIAPEGRAFVCKRFLPFVEFPL